MTIGELGCLCAGVIVVSAKEIAGCRDVATPIQYVGVVLMHRNDLLWELMNLGQVAKLALVRWGPPEPSSRALSEAVFILSGKSGNWEGLFHPKMNGHEVRPN